MHTYKGFDALKATNSIQILVVLLLASCSSPQPNRPQDTTTLPTNQATQGAQYRATSLAYQTQRANRLASASPTHTASPRPTITVTLTPVRVEWIEYQSEEFGAAFEYPAFYETGPGGHLVTGENESDYLDLSYKGDPFIAFRDSTISISMTSPWNGNFDEHVQVILKIKPKRELSFEVTDRTQAHKREELAKRILQGIGRLKGVELISTETL